MGQEFRKGTVGTAYFFTMTGLEMLGLEEVLRGGFFTSEPGTWLGWLKDGPPQTADQYAHLRPSGMGASKSLDFLHSSSHF